MVPTPFLWRPFILVRPLDVGAQRFGDLVVVDDEVAGSGVGFDVGGFACAGWSDDEDDSGVGVFPGFLGFALDASEVAVLAGGSKVVGIPPGSALGGGDDVVDVGGVAGAFG